jgi:flavin reductase (DIM6/NTAB) family NADH-FMN oxidoreductase RutF
MRSYDAKSLSNSEKYFLMISGIAPRPIAFVSTISTEGIANLAPFSFFNACGCEPPIVIFCPAAKDDEGKIQKDTYNNLIATKECVIHSVTYEMREKMLITSKDFAANINEFEESGFTAIKSDLVKAPRVKESPFQMECRLLEMKNYGTGNLAICEVLKFHIEDSWFKNSDSLRIDQDQIDLIGRNGGAYYTRSNSSSRFEMK